MTNPEFPIGLNRLLQAEKSTADNSINVNVILSFSSLSPYSATVTVMFLL
uniref:Uncharacterized protein n=1 Tax=uncultured bacterium contig00063 TaxID=1181546 RepID=A0A806JZ29_9BACT|nr:hypothetical protein [uncultured bacterium contig00063]